MFLVAPYRLVRRLSVVGLILLAACGGGGGEKPNPQPAAPDFALSLSPANVSIPAGGSAFVTVTLSRLNGFTSAVNLSGEALPSGVTASGTIAAGASTLQLAVAVAPGVAASSYSGVGLRGQAGSLTHDAPLALTVAAPLAASHLRDDLVQAAGGRQTGGSIENHAVAREALPAQIVKDANDTTRVRQGFLPAGSPTDH